MKHFPFWHTYIPRKVVHYTDISWGGRAPSSRVVSVCVCGAIKTEDFYGVGQLTLEDISPLLTEDVVDDKTKV